MNAVPREATTTRTQTTVPPQRVSQPLPLQPSVPDDETEPAEPEPPRSRRVTIAASGDALFHIKVVKAGRAHGFDHVLRGLRGLHDEDAITYVNLETPLVNDVLPVATGTPPLLGAPGEVADALAGAGVDVAGCANNHAYDQNAIGLARTLTLLSDAGVVPVGAGPTKRAAQAHQIVERQGLRVAFLSFTKRINRGAGSREPEAFIAWMRDREALNDAIERARADADVVVLGLHWSGDYAPRPTHAQRALARDLITRGVDVIFGSGPHVLHEVERIEGPRGDALVAYSLGNLISNQGSRYRVGRRINPRGHPALVQPHTRDGVLLSVDIVLDDAAMNPEAERPRLSLRARGEPLFTDNNFFRVHRGEEEHWDIATRSLLELDAATREERFPVIRAALGDEVEWADPAP